MSFNFLEISDDGKVLLKCDRAVEDCIIVPEGIETIDSYAFQGCSAITKIVLPNSLRSIEWYAFDGCKSLTEINIPDSIEKLPWYCFRNCESLKHINLPYSLKSILYNAFSNCYSLTEIDIPDSVTLIGDEAFINCLSLESVSLPSNLEDIRSEAFSGCEALAQITVPKEVKNIGDKAFENCSNLNCVIIESDKVKIAPTAFLNCQALNRLYLSNFNPNIVISSFGDCTNLSIVSPISDINRIRSSNSIGYNTIHQVFADNLRYMALYYRLFGMNLTQMKWSESLRNLQSLKEPINTNWQLLKHEEQNLRDLLNINWSNSCGIGLVLGFNDFRALDFDFDIDGDFIYNGDSDEDFIEDFIEKILCRLGLPADYPWVVRSGNGYGFHIIFKSTDIEAIKEIDVISLEPICQYYYIYKFKCLELRWSDHLVLPPSLHASGNQYRFRNGSLPVSEPTHLDLNVVDDLLYEYCGDRVFLDGIYGDSAFEYTRIEKIEGREFSTLAIEYYNDTVPYLKSVQTAESLNNLALCYLFGEGIDGSADMAYKYLCKSKSQSSIFNLLSLYACGYYKCNREEYDRLFATLDLNLFKDHLTVLQDNANKYIPKSELYLFLDSETTGLPKNYNVPTNVIDNWPRIVQLSWIVADEFQNIVSQHNHIIKPDGFTIPADSVAIHGITNNYATENGVSLLQVIKLLEKDLEIADYVVGHNIRFDLNVIESENYRNNYELKCAFPKVLCTMKSTTDFCKQKMPYHSAYRYPKLQELYSNLFGDNFSGAHNAFEDIKATMKCFWELRNNHGFSIDDFKTS